MSITKDDFDLWRASPVTERVMRALVKLAERNKDQWVAASWDGGNADPITLAQCKARYETAVDLSELTFEQMEETIDEKRERDQSHRIQSADRPEEGG